MVVLAVAAVVIAVMVTRATNDALTRATIDTLETDGRRLGAVFAEGGIERLVMTIEGRGALKDGALFRLVDRNGRMLAGNLAEPPELGVGSAGGGVFRYAVTTGPAHGPSRATSRRLAAARLLSLGDGMTLVVARDIEHQRDFLVRSNRALFIGVGLLALLGLAAGVLLSRSVLARVDAMTATSRAIMAGNLGRRLPRTSAGDELDRLADGLNAMLDRIEQLMGGLKEVSDNIAHDLKTPLNRLRNRAEAALADPRGGEGWREGLAETIEDADELIKTFNALLLIARLEAGAVDETLETVDVTAMVDDLGELYAPAAEEAGLDLEVSPHAATPALVQANRQLVGQAISNLIENAIKYAAPEAGGRSPVKIALTTPDGMVEIAVGDRGPGIPEADRARAMRRFVRLEASRSKPGTGLGLSLVAAVAQLHGGSLRLEDNAPGLRAVLSLPMMARRRDSARAIGVGSR